MTSRHLTVGLLVAAGLALYLVPAFEAPVVLWSDSHIDLDWARRGIGIFSAVPESEQLAAGVHQAKPLYLLFLRCAIAIAPAGGEARAVVVLQALLLCAVILWVSLRGGAPVATSLLLLLCLRLRDSASTVMSEPLTAALLLVAARGILVVPETWAGASALGATVGTLFWVRPNAGGIALVLVAARFLLCRRLGAGLRVAAGFLVIAVPIAIASRPGPRGPALRGLAFPLLVGSTDYCWEPAVPAVEAGNLESRQREELRRTRESWSALFRSLRLGDPDAWRQLNWRTFRGLFGSEYSDGRWSSLYLTIANASKLLTPILVLAALALFLTLPFRTDRSLNLVVLLLFGALLAQNLVLGSLPRYDLPFLPVVFFFAVPAAAETFRDRKRAIVAACVFLASLGLGFRCPYVFDEEWGRIESAGVTLRQPIPKGSLPKSEPATLHLRIGVASLPSAAQLEVYAPDGQRLFSSAEGGARERPEISLALPQWLLEQNSNGPVEIRIVSTAGFGPESFLLFPVITPPWAGGTSREGSESLSPSTGIRSGSLDWWAHAGSDPPREVSTDRQNDHGIAGLAVGSGRVLEAGDGPH